MKKMLGLLALILIAASIVGCASKADTASRNLSLQADNFQVYRRIVFINGITDKYLLQVEGFCSLGNNDPPRELSITCMIGDGRFIKDFVYMSDNVTYTVHQVEGMPVGTYRYEYIFRPETILPDIRMDTRESPVP
jgi:hypothetical protein